jgi:hypothetical protein
MSALAVVAEFAVLAKAGEAADTITAAQAVAASFSTLCRANFIL